MTALASNRAIGTGGHVDDHNEIARRLISVDDYGAVGDGSADDTTAIQAAVDALMAAKAGRLVFQPGKQYKITDTILFQPSAAVIHPILIDGQGAVILTNVTGVPGFKFADSGAFGWRGLVMRDLFFDANAGTPSDVVRVEGGLYRFSLENVVLENFTGHGIHIVDCWEFQLCHCQCGAKAANLTGACIYLEDVVEGSISSVNVINCNTRCGKYGLHSTGSVELMLMGGTYLLAREYGVRLEWCNNASLFHPHVENNWQSGTPGAGLYFGGIGTITAPKFYQTGNQTKSIEVYPGKSLVVLGFDDSPLGAYLVVQNNPSGPNTVTTVGVPESKIDDNSDGVNTVLVIR